MLSGIRHGCGCSWSSLGWYNNTLCLLLHMNIINSSPTLISCPLYCLEHNLPEAHLHLAYEPLIVSKDGSVLQVPHYMFSTIALCQYS